jgi:HEPN domain-containing protein
MNSEEFGIRMRSADTELRLQGYSVAQRAHLAFDKISPGSSFTFLPSWQRNRFPNREHEGQDLYEKVQEWYSQHYGERSQWILRLDSLPIIVLDDIYFIRIPICFGAGLHRIEVMELVEGFTPLTGSLLTGEEINAIARTFEEGYHLMLSIQNLFNVVRSDSTMTRLASDPFLISADRDRVIAGRSLAIPYDTNNSAFHSQQWAEKMLKSLLFSAEGIEEISIENDFRHGVLKIWNHLKTRREGSEHLGGSVRAVSSIKMRVRYSREEMKLSDAVNIFWDSLRVSAYCAEILQRFPHNPEDAPNTA